MEALNIGKGMRSKREVKIAKFARFWTGQSRLIDMQNNTNNDITVTVTVTVTFAGNSGQSRA